VNQTFNSTKGTGRRKSAVATVELVRGTGKFTINTIPGIDYMQKKADLLLLFKPIRFISAKII
jgi:ribosomal protein S9